MTSAAGLAVEVRPLTGALGAEATGVDLTRPLDEAEFEALHEAFLAHCVLVFRGQFLGPAEHLRFASRWGTPFVPPFMSAHAVPDFPEILRVTNVGKANAVTENWHTDSSFLPRPPAITILAAQELPATGGDTMWANQYLAHDELSPGMRRMIAGLRAEFCGSLPTADGGREEIATLQPVVRTHPETGRRALYLGHPGDSVTRFEAMTPEESRPLLEYLYAHAARPDFVYRHQWTPGDLVMWDNRCTMHYAVHDYGDAVRVLNRITIEGDEPR